MNNFMMLVGLPGSGKSYWAEKHAEVNHHAVIHSSDALRRELFGSEDVQDRNRELFEELHRRIKADLLADKDVIYDATNINSKRRTAFLQEIENIDCRKTAIVMSTPFIVCLKNNWTRERIVPFEVMDRMYKNWQTPYYFEGWDNIYKIDYQINYHDTSKMLDRYWNYDQNNPNHKYSLGMHMSEVGLYLLNNPEVAANENLIDAGFYHDIGKPYCRTTDENGISHYYNHANVGAYDAMTEWDCSVRTSALINYHMYPFSWTEEKTKEKYKKLWGKEFYNEIVMLHRADIDHNIKGSD